MEIPPGLKYLSRALPLTLLPCAATYLVLGAFPLPLWSRVLAALLAQPLGLIFADWFKETREAGDAHARGAELIPVIRDSRPFGLNTLSVLRKSFKSGYPGDFIEDWREEYGNTFITKVMLNRVITTVEPDHVKAILATEFDNYWKGPHEAQMSQSLLGFGIFNTDDELWRFHRSLARPFFSRERISDFDIFDHHTREALALLKKRLAEGHPVDFQDLASRFTLDSATSFLFGKSIDSMSAGLPYPESSPLADSPAFHNHPSNTYVRSFVQSQVFTVQRAALQRQWPLVEFWKDRVKPHRKIIDEFIEPILNEALAKKNKGTQGGEVDGKMTEVGGEEETFLSHLVQATDDKEIIRDSIFNILIAGRDTTAATLTFGVYMLAEHPEILAKLRAEILETVGSSRMPTYDDLRHMKYLRAFLNETLRLYPPVPFDSRASKKATVWPATRPGEKAFYVPARTRCRYSVFVMHRRTDLWGPDALEFDPDRFLDDRVRKYLTPNPFIFLPFNGGPRICLGQQFAYHEASFFLVRLLQSFTDFSLAPDAQPEASKPPLSWKTRKGTQAREKVRLGMHLTMYSKGGLWVQMNELKG
ncbi:cytochrome P450 monooxygenase pc-3 [Mycena amicta]|nr:cytochrome P450 monooxygenase pc-3 [Mycena amicta]